MSASIQTGLYKTERIPNLGSFFVFGLVNNFAYVVFLSAAGDLLPQNLSASVVLLAEMIPIIATQGIAPFFIERVPFWFRVLVIALSSVGGFLIVAFFDTLEVKLAGVALGSISSGFGEITFMALSSFFLPSTVSLYSSGTGGAGVFGSLIYLAFTTWIKLTPFLSLIIVSPVPLAMAFMYFFVLEKKPGIRKTFDLDCSKDAEKEQLIKEQQQYYTITEKLYLQIELFKYWGPLFLVYFGEYLINYGLFQVLLFPRNEMFSGSEYKYYSFIYQVGVFISRSSANFFRIKYLWLLGTLQIVNLVFLGTVAYFDYIPSIWIIFVIILYEGLIGGAVFVNAFYRIADEVAEEKKKEFCMASISFWYSIGILLAGVGGIFLQPWLADVRKARNPVVPAPAPFPVPEPYHPGPVPNPSVPIPHPAPQVPVPTPVPVPHPVPLPTPVPVPVPHPVPLPAPIPTPQPLPVPSPK
jgi:battenin